MTFRTLLAAAGFALAALAPDPTLAADKLTVLLEWFVNPDHVPLVVAREKGFFQAEGWTSISCRPPIPPLRHGFWRQARPTSRSTTSPT